MTAPPRVDVPRKWGQPQIIPPGGGDLESYTRVSVMAKTLEDPTYGLMPWKQRKNAEGLLYRPDLMTRLAGILANGNPDEDDEAKKALNAVCKEATEAAQASKGASSGTGLHALTEAIDRGEEPQWIPEHDRTRLEAYRKATAGYQALDAEVFVVCDQLRVGGSFDRLWRCPDGVIRIGDLKSGKHDANYPLSTCIQLALYAHGQRYDPETGARAPIHPDLDLTTGLLIHMPPKGGCAVIPLDLEKGWRAARAAAFVHHTVRRWKADDIIRGGA